MASNDVWDDNVNESGLHGMYIANPDFSSRREDADDKPQLLYRSSERLKESMWDAIKENAWHYLSKSLYVSNY